MIKTGINPYKQPSFGLRNRLGRLLWSLVYNLVFKLSPRTTHEFRSIILRSFGAKIGNNCHVYPGVKIWAPWNLVMEDEAGMADGVICYSMATITLREKVVVSQGTHLCSGTHDYQDPDFQLQAFPITIGERAWICADVFIGPGVAVGAGAVIGARSVVTRNMPEWTVCAGHPCQPLKKRIIRAKDI